MKKHSSLPKVLDGHDIIGIGREFNPKKAAVPILYPPGSPQKIEALRARVAACEELFHSEDCCTYEHVQEVIRRKNAIPWNPKDNISRMEMFIIRVCDRSQWGFDDV